MKEKLGPANERAMLAGRDPLIQRGAIVKSGRTRYLVESVRGSTVTVRILVPWHKRAAAAVARGAARLARFFRIRRPKRPERVPVDYPVYTPSPKEEKMTAPREEKPPISSWWIVAGTMAAIGAAIWIWG